MTIGLRTSNYASMRLTRAASTFVRATFAVVFGFVSLAHGPVMAFAAASQPSAQHWMVNEQHLHASHQPAPLIPQQPSVCNSFGCFVAVEPALVSGPAVGFVLLERLSPLLVRPAVATSGDPTDPPPRLQA